MTRAMRSLITDHGQSMDSLRACAPLRTRASKSPIGSVIDIAGPSPARLGQPRNLSLAGQIAQTQAAHAEAAEERPRTAAQRASVEGAHFELRRALRLDAQTRLGHAQSS